MTSIVSSKNVASTVKACDFSRSYFHFRIDLELQRAITVTRRQPFTMNHVRIPLECRCELTAPDGRTVQYILGASCKTELVNVRRDMWVLPNADFCPIVSDDDAFLILKSWDRRDKGLEQNASDMAPFRDRQHGKARDAWAEHRLDVARVDAEALTSAQAVYDAVMNNEPLVSQTQLQLDGGWTALIEYPVKTINVSDRDGYYQVDTGPVILPTAIDGDAPIEAFRLAYVAHNAPDWVEFIVNVPTAIGHDISVDHYSKVVQVAAVNRMLRLV